MSIVQSHAVLSFPSDAATLTHVGARASAGDMYDGFQLPAGWWLLPSVIGGASIWALVIRAIFF